ncbi:DUF2510 domain-containing protein [Parenemella sanctibonifatiensis]|nr:DUF2510 domain-containing protein [Parenemella sanctibonifatiensis]
MSAQPGWYPDPAGQPGMYRYWDGQQWAAEASPTPGGSGAPSDSGGSQGGGRSGPGLWIAIAVGALVIVLIAIFAIPRLGDVLGGDGTEVPPSQGDVCPPAPETPIPPDDQPGDGRVHGGGMSYPLLGSPWGAPEIETRMPFGAGVIGQIVTVEPNYAPGQSWVASVHIGRLVAGDGFYSPEAASEIVVRCILGSFYGDNEVTRSDQVNEARTVEGHEAWLVETELSFDIENLRTTNETAIILIVAIDAESAGIFFASIPNTAPELLQPARDSMDAIRIEG